MQEKITSVQANAMECVSMKQEYTGLADQAVRFIERVQSTDRLLWKRFADQFREQLDGENRGWRGEYWGKMMRGATLVYRYSQSEEVYEVLTESIRDMLTVAEADGRVSSFSRETEFDAWDMWCRKYVMLGMEYYLEICRDKALEQEIIAFLCGLADYILAHIGKEDGKIEITKASCSWRGINSSSILEPMVRLYRLTGEKRYFDFSTYIIELGAADGINIFELAYENRLLPYQYGVSKAYEMISCFEGLLEYYRITGIEKYKTAAVNFGHAVIESEVSVIGSCGCTHELFDHTKTRQTAYYDGVMQETCVTVTWMKYCAQLLRLTGDRCFGDQIDQSFHNAYLGAMNTELRHCPYIEERFLERFHYPRVEYTLLPFDSYSPLRPDKRGKKVGGSQILSDYRYYGCCACIAAAGVGVYLSHAVMRDADGLVIQMYETGTTELMYDGVKVTLTVKTGYPADGRIALSMKTDKPLAITLKMRLPAWSKNARIESDCTCTFKDGYAVLYGFQSGDRAVLDLDMRIRVTKPISWESDVLYVNMIVRDGSHQVEATRVEHSPEDDSFVSLSRGPLTLAADSRSGKAADSVFSFQYENGEVAYRICEKAEIAEGIPCTLACELTDEEGNRFRLVDYASAGRDWQTVIAAWLPTAER